MCRAGSLSMPPVPPVCWLPCPPSRSGAQCHLRVAFPTCHCVLSRRTLWFSCPSPAVLCIHYVFLWATSGLVSILPHWPRSSAGAGIVSFVFPVLPTEPRTVFGGAAPSPEYLVNTCLWGLDSRARSGLAVWTGQWPDGADGDCSPGSGQVPKECRGPRQAGAGDRPGGP